MKILFAASCLLLSGCSMDASISDILPPLPTFEKSQIVNSDIVMAETVTTNNGVVITGAFGEISEKKTLSNGVQIEGAFYE